MDSQSPDTSEPRSDDFIDFTLGSSGVPGQGNSADLGRGNVREMRPNTDTAIEVDAVEIIAPSSAAQAPSGTPRNQPPAPPRDDDAGDQIDKYMADLMKRYGMPAEASPADPVPKAKAATVPDKPATEAAEAPPPREPTVPPELSLGLNAMRDLANTNARRAITKHVTERLTKQAFIKLVLSLFAIVVALVMAELSLPGHTVLFVIAVVAMTSATLWGVQYLLTTRQLLVQLPKKTAPPPAAATGVDQTVSVRADDDVASGAHGMLARRPEKL